MIVDNKYDLIVIGAGAAGLMSAVTAAERGKNVLIIEHTAKIGEKIRISGGGRCNFTNLYTNSNNFISQNPHFVKSALSQYTQHDFISLIESYKIAYHEKTLGQLFCDGSSKQIIEMFIDLCNKNNIEIKLSYKVTDVSKDVDFKITTEAEEFLSKSVVIATGGLSIPKIGATDFGYKIAQKFGHRIIKTSPALVPLTVPAKNLDLFLELRGVSNYSTASYKNTSFKEGLLFTHKGLSGPSILQISSYLDKFKGEKICINLLPEMDLKSLFIENKNSKQTPANYLKTHLTNRLVDNLALLNSDFDKNITDLSNQKLFKIADLIHNFEVQIEGSEGYLKAEVTKGGVDTSELSSKTMESKKIKGLFFVGEVVDVTGWLGGYNFQWGWSSGFAAGKHL